MKYAALILLLLFSSAAVSQTPNPKATPTKRPSVVKGKSTSSPKTALVGKAGQAKRETTPPLSEKEQFEKISAMELAADRVPALEKFLTAFPESEHRADAAELLASSRILIADEKLMSGDADGAIALFKLVLEQTPQPVLYEMFDESISKIPSTLFFRGQRPAALEFAAVIENKVEGNAAQLLEIANFHIATENGAEAMRVAAKAAAKDPNSAAVHRTMGLAHRINFDLDLAADAYSKSLELEPSSSASKRSLAEMKRALGKSDEAVALYRELLTANESDLPSQTGLILALFDAGKRSEAEAEMAKSLEQKPANVILMAGAAYWYASKGLGDKAVELAQKALTREPRYIWSHIALARGLMSQGKPVEAEQALIKARAFGNFPTLEYELASARIAAGFFREAAEDLKTQFTVTSDGNVKTNLGGRVVREEKSLADLAGFERKASIFTPAAADTADGAEILKSLLILDQKVEHATPNETEIAAAADAFTKGSDKMKLHRQIYAASLLLQKRIAIGKVLELTKAATGNSDAALEVANPRAAVMASELYEARSAAFRKNEFLLVPEVPANTLSGILRGRIEDIAGWALYQQSDFPGAVVRLRRAISVMPDKSAWWRASLWRLGAALAADGKEAEALNSYIESYKTDKPDFAKYTVVEALYKKLNGNIDGLEEKLGRDRVPVTSAAQEIQPSPTPAQNVEVPAAGRTTDAPSASSSPAPASTEPVPDRTMTEPAKTEPTKTEPIKLDEAAKTEPATLDETTKAEVPTKQAPDTRNNAVPIKSAADSKTEPATREIKIESPPSDVKTEPTPEDARKEVSTPEVKTEVPAKVEPSVTEPDPEPKPVQKEVPNEPVIENPNPKAETKPPEIKKEPEKKEEAEKKEEPEIKREPEDTGGAPSKPLAAQTTPEPTADSNDIKDMRANKLLFEPIIITVPRRSAAKVPAAKSTSDQSTAGGPTKLTSEEKPAGSASTTAGVARPRLIDGEEIKLDEPRPCVVGVSQESVSIINDGGRVGILVNVDMPGDVKDLRASSSSPKDVELTLQPEIGGIADKLFYVIKSISSSLGVFRVTFAAPCGKKDVTVTVR